MASVSNSLYKYSVNGITYYQMLPDYNVDPSLKKVTNLQEVKDYINYLRSLGTYTPGSRTGVQFDAQQVANDIEAELNRFIKNPDSGFVDSYKAPWGETLTLVSKSQIEEIEKQQQGIKDGSLRVVGTSPSGAPLTVPVGSAGDKLLSGQQTQQGGGTTNTQVLGDIQGGSSQQSGQFSGYPTQNLQPGQRGDEVKQLQDWLVANGYMTQDQVNTGYGIYGPQTTAAVAQLQKDLGVDTAGNPGYWGPRTLSALDGFISSYGSNPSDSVNPNGSDPGTGGSGGTRFEDQLQEPFKSLYSTMKGFLDELQKRGQTINADVEITPDRVAEFMTQAESNIDLFIPYAQKEILPYYQNQLKLAKEGFLRSLGYSADELARTEQDIQRRFEKSFKGIGETAAEKGFALSGARVQEEKELTDETQRSIETGRRGFGFEAGNRAREFAQNYGTENVPNFEAPGIGKALYELSPETYSGLKGTQQFQQEADIKSRASELEQAFRSQAALDQQKKLLI